MAYSPAPVPPPAPPPGVEAFHLPGRHNQLDHAGRGRLPGQAPRRVLAEGEAITSGHVIMVGGAPTVYENVTVKGPFDRDQHREINEAILALEHLGAGDVPIEFIAARVESTNVAGAEVLGNWDGEAIRIYPDLRAKGRLKGTLAHELWHAHEGRMATELERRLAAGEPWKDYDVPTRLKSALAATHPGQTPYSVLVEKTPPVSDYGRLALERLGPARGMSENFAEVARLRVEGRYNEVPAAWRTAYEALTADSNF